MGGSIQFAKLFGIPVRLHWTFFLLFAGLALLGWSQTGSFTYLMWSSLFLLAVFTCVVLHEFGHALTARIYGVKTVDIILSPIGGIARLDKLPENPWQEFKVAIAGPLVNIAIALLISPFLFLVDTENSRNFFELLWEGNLPALPVLLSSFFLASLFVLNISLAVFNLIPAFPMDGGRIFRALLSIPLNRVRATRIASITGQFFAVLMVVYGIWSYSIVLAIIGVFIFLSASQEYRMIETESWLSDQVVGTIMRKDFTLLSYSDLLSKPLHIYLRGNERNFMVSSDADDRVVALLPETALMDALRTGETSGTVENFLIPIKPDPIPEDTNLREAYDSMREANREALLIRNETGQITGILEMYQIHFFLQLQQRLKKQAKG
ncbi:MAG: site-2 protease family protein [Bacteroidetes bacterium]|nr:site-2 protease family protein [Bacteroidota bacterium]